MNYFIAIDFPERIINELARVQREFKRADIFTGNYVAPAQAHITLKFLGVISAQEVELARSRLRTVAHEPFQVLLGDVGIFSPERPRVLWVALHGAGLMQLQQKIEQVIADLFAPEQRAFAAHVTLARIKRVHNEREWHELLERVSVQHSTFIIESFVLKQSELTAEEPIYKDIEKFVL